MSTAFETSAETTRPILVVDDDADIRCTLTEFLEYEGYAVETARNGREALAYLRTHPSALLVLLDLMMPVMDGFQFRIEQKKTPELASIPVVVMTAHAALKPGAIDVPDVLSKPLDLDRLVDAIERVAQRNPAARARQELRAGQRVTDVRERRAPRDCFAGGGEAGRLMRQIDWAKTALGPVEGWSQALRTTVGLLLHNHSPMLLWWGPRFVQIYNDAYRPVTGDKHPRSLGQTGPECWPDIWHILGPMAERPLRGGQASTADDLFLLLNRRGFVEETHFKIAYSPVPDESVEPTGIGGVLATVAETTEQVYGDRQLRTLRELGARGAAAKTTEEACAVSGAIFAENDWDVPFALFYLLDDDGKRVRLASSVGFESIPSPAAPFEIELSENAPASAWPMRQIIAEGKPLVLEGLSERLSPLPMGRWSLSPHTAMALPLGSPDEPHAYGVLICGVSPHRALTTGYRTFFELAAAQVVTAIRNVRAYQAERKRAEDLAELDRAKTNFFSNISHEFRTPLTLMLGPLEDHLQGARGAVSPPLRDELEVVYRNGVRLLKLVNTLLDFSRIEAGRIQAVYEPTDLAELTADLASVFRSALEKAGLRLQVDCPPLPQPIYVDQEMWEKIVLNLVSNAFKFTFEGEIDVSLRWAGDHVALEVGDTGTGIPSEELPHLFERFHRVHGARARTHEGSGIGLALVQELVKLHRGTVRVHSILGKGTTFTVSIPAGAAHLPPERIDTRRRLSTTPIGASAFAEEALRWLPDEPQEELPSSRTKTVESRPEPGVSGNAVGKRRSKARILLVDDNADMREYVRRLLSDQWEVETASNGIGALAAARERPPDLILTDVMMPELDGFGLLREIRGDSRTRMIPVIMLSARAGEEARIDGLRAGADEYLVKPFSAREVVARVGSQLALASLRREVEKERQARVDELAETVRVSEMFVGILGHDLRNPLGSIITAATVLVAKSKESFSDAKSAARILSSAQRMQRMIEQLLDLTQARLGGGLALQRTLVDLADLCRGAIDELDTGSNRISIRCESAGDTKGEWDRDRLAQLISNLIGNALAHGRPSSPADLAVDGSLPDDVWIEIHNDGAIPAEILPGVFEPFRSTRSTREKRPGASGLGLGLFISKQIVVAHGGSIEVDSSLETGTTFTVRLPRRAPALTPTNGADRQS